MIMIGFDWARDKHNVRVLNRDGETLHGEAYRCIVGKLTYLTSKVFVEASNVSRSLSRYFHNPGPGHWKELEHVLGYMRGHADDVRLRIRTPRTLVPEALVDANYATCRDTRKSVSGALLTIGGSLVGWFSRTQNTVALSSTEAEYIALSNATQELIFLRSCLVELGLYDGLAAALGDNIGALFLARNAQFGPRTKHIDVRYHFMRHHMMDGHMVVAHIAGDDNDSDMLTKNADGRTHTRHATATREGTNAIWSDWSRVTTAIDRAVDFGLVRASGGGCCEGGPTGSDPRTRTSTEAAELLGSDADVHVGRTSASDTVHTPSTDRSATPAAPSGRPDGIGSSVPIRPPAAAAMGLECSSPRRNFVPEREDSGVPSADRWADDIARHSAFGTGEGSGEVKPPSSEGETDRVG